MALSTSVKRAQSVILCDLCKADTKIKWQCVNCNLLMCIKCKEKVHSKVKSANNHTIKDIKEVGKYSAELDFSTISCEDHEGQICFKFCKSCDHLVCPQCIAKVHEGHGLVEISRGFKIQIENMKKIQEQIKSHIEELTNGETKIKLLRKNESSKYNEIRNLIQAQNAALKLEIDKYTEKLIKELDQKWETLQNSFTEVEHKVIAMKIGKENENAKANEIINSNNSNQAFKESKQMITSFKKGNMEHVKLDFSTMPKFVPGEINEYNFGSLHAIQVVKDLVLYIHQQFITDLTRVFHVSICPDNSIWIGDKNIIQRVQREGSNLKVMSNSKLNMEMYGMALTPSNDLLLVTKGASRLKQISGSSGQLIDSVYSVDPLRITAVHVTSNNQVMVGAYGRGRDVVISLNKEGKHEKTYEHYRNKQPIFTDVRNITTTKNGTIFVVDSLSEDRGRVVVLEQDGDVFNTYTGNSSINNEEKPFKPRNVVTTPLDNIIVTDPYTYTLHILNNVGHAVTCYNTNNIGIIFPYSLSFTSSGHLFIGCSTPLSSKDKAKLYKVDISHM